MRNIAIRETEAALCMGAASLCLDVTSIPFEVKVSSKLVELWNPRFANLSARLIARYAARNKVDTAVNQWLYGG